MNDGETKGERFCSFFDGPVLEGDRWGGGGGGRRERLLPTRHSFPKIGATLFRPDLQMTPGQKRNDFNLLEGFCFGANNEGRGSYSFLLGCRTWTLPGRPTSLPMAWSTITTRSLKRPHGTSPMPFVEESRLTRGTGFGSQTRFKATS